MKVRNPLFVPFVDKVIGKILLTKPIEHTRRDYECAAWHQTHVTDTGVFDVKLTLNYLYPDQHPGAVAVIPATITDDFFPALFGGNMVAGTGKPKHVGQRTTHTISVPLYQAMQTCGNSPHHLSYSIPDADGLWDLIDKDMENRVIEAVERLPEFYKAWRAETAHTIHSKLSMVGYFGREMADWEDRLTEFRRHLGYWRPQLQYPANWDLVGWWEKNKPKEVLA